MIILIKNEFKKFSNSYINIVSLLAMLFPVVFTFIVYHFSGDKMMGNDWAAYTASLHLFYGVFLGGLIPSFIAIFSIYYEFKEGTIKNLLTSPHSKLKIILSKILYVCLFIALMYTIIAVLVVVSGLMLGFDSSASAILNSLKFVIIPGLSTIVFVPMMVFLTLLFKSFIPPLVFALIGTIAGLPLLNLGKAYYYPWTIPSNFFFKLRLTQPVSFLSPIILLSVYFSIFLVFSTIMFYRMDARS